MDTLALQCEVLHQLILLSLSLGCAEGRMLDCGYLGAHIREDEEVRIRDFGRQDIVSLVGEVNSMVLLIDHEIKFVGNLRHLALIVLDIEVLCLLHQLLHARLAE